MIAKAIKSIFSKTGIHVIKRTKHNGSTRFRIGDFQYDVVTPSANYAPWYGDPEFLNIYKEIKKNTLVDIYRCYELWKLAEKICKLDKSAHFIEIGVWKGGTAGIIGRKLALMNSNNDFYLADTFAGVAKASDKDTFYNGGEHADTSQEIVEQLISGKYKNYKILKGIFPDETAQLICSTNKFGFCHIDVDVYESARGIVDWIWEKTIIGGVIIFDDYGFHSCNGVTKYVDEQKEKTDRVVIHNLNGHAIMIKLY